MKKVFLVVLAFVLLCGVALGEGIDWAGMTDDQLQAALDAGQAELISRRKSNQADGAVLITDGAVLLDAEGVTVTVEGDPWFSNSGDRQYIYFNTVTVNGSDQEMTVDFDTCSVNDWDCNGYGPGSVPAGKKSRDESYIHVSDAGIASFDEIYEFSMSIRMFNEDFDTVYEGPILQYTIK